MKILRKKKKLITKTFARIRIKSGKRENSFIKHDIARNIHPTSSNIQALVPFMHITIAKKGTLLGTKLKFMFIVWSEIRPTCTAKDTKRGIRGGLIK